MKTNFYKNEIQSVCALALIFAFRMLGLFMILPIFSVAATNLSGGTPGLMGLALGIYGLTQAICQVPFGILSDRFGRKPIIMLGLILFLLGSVVAAFASSMTEVIIGRAIQGAGAVGSVILALLADVTQIENRTRAMAMVGVSIGCSFMLSILLGPLVYQYLALSGLFWVMTGMALLGSLILHFAVKIPRENLNLIQQASQPSIQAIQKLIFQPELLRLNLGIFFQHAILTASFIVIPKILSNEMHWPVTQYWKFYLPILMVALIGAFPLISLSEKRRFVRAALLCSISVMGLCQISLAYLIPQWFFVITVLSVFFLAFTLLEAFLPSLISKIASLDNKGTAMGIYSTSQFLGIFFGGSLGGMVFLHFGLNGVFWFDGILAILWLLIAMHMKSPPYLVTRVLSIGRLPIEEAKKLNQQFLFAKGVSEAAISSAEGAVYLKVDPLTLDEDHLQKIMNQLNAEKSNG